MSLKLLQAALLLVAGSCGAAPSEPQAQAQGKPRQAFTARPFSVTPVASFDSPWAMDFLPGSGLPLTNMALVTEKAGRLWMVDVATGKKQPVGGLPQVLANDQGGLADVAVHPEFAGNSRVYLSFTEAGPNGTSGAAIGYGAMVVGGPAIPGGPVAYQLTNFKVIWRQQPKVTGGGHYSQRIAFAPDGTMFVSSGDRQKGGPAQDANSDLGKIIHLTAEGQRIGGGFHSTGHRNALGLAFAPDGRLWSSEMGPKGGDELNLIQQGKNYGWPLVSYGSEYSGGDIPDAHAGRGFEEPKVWWTPSVSPGSLLIYNGDAFPQWKGDALIPALSGQALIRVDIEGDTARKADQWDMDNRIREVAQGPRGIVYLLEDGPDGRLLRLEPRR